MEPPILTIEVGKDARDYRIGDYLNAIDEVTCYFTAKSCEELKYLASALRTYADRLEEI